MEDSSSSDDDSCSHIRHRNVPVHPSETSAEIFSSKLVEYHSSSEEEDDLPPIIEDESKENEMLALRYAEKGHCEHLKNLLALHPGLIDATDDDLYSPLHRAAYNGHIDCMKVLIEAGANVHSVTLEGWIPLHSACHWNKVEAANLLIQCGSRVNSVSNSGTTPLHTAAQNAKASDCIRLLLNTRGIDVHLKTDAGESGAKALGRFGPYGDLTEAFESFLNWD